MPRSYGNGGVPVTKPNRFSRLKVFLKQNGLRILLPVLILLLSLLSYKILILPTGSDLPALSECTRFVLPPIAILAVCAALFRRYCAAFSLFSGYHVGILLTFIGAHDSSSFYLTVFLSLLCSLLIGVWLEVLPLLFAKWKKKPSNEP